MNKNKLQEMIRELISKVLNENAPAPAPSKPKPSPGPAVAPGKPNTKPQKPRRPLGNPEVKPGPKAEGLNEEEMLQKIVDRFKSKDKKELKEASSKVDLTKHHQDQISDLSPEQKKKLHKDLTDATAEVNDKDFKTKAEYAEAMKAAKTRVYKKYIKL